MRRKVDNLLALAVLSYLTQGPLHPYELGRTLQRHGDARSVRYRHASLYMVVNQLTAAGLIIAVDTERDGGRPERTRYALTDSGRAELTDWLRELLAEPTHEYPRFVAALAFLGALRPDEAVAALDRRLAGLAALRAEAAGIIAQADADGVHPLFLVEEEYRLAVLDAELDFVHTLRSRIDDPATGWRTVWSPSHRQPGGVLVMTATTDLIARRVTSADGTPIGCLTRRPGTGAGRPARGDADRRQPTRTRPGSGRHLAGDLAGPEGPRHQRTTPTRP